MFFEDPSIAIPTLLVGGGSACMDILQTFSSEPNIKLVGVVELPGVLTPAISLANILGVPCYDDIDKAITMVGTGCLAFNLTGDESISDQLTEYIGTGGVIGGRESSLFWKMFSSMKSSKKSLSNQKVRLDAILNNICEGIVVIDNSLFIENCNPSFESMFDVSESDVIGNSITSFFPSNALSNLIDQLHIESSSSHVEVEVYRSDGSSFHVELSCSVASISDSDKYILIVRDITENKSAREKLVQMAMFDNLTKLPNRFLFYDRLDTLLTQAKRNYQVLSVLFIDLDGFKGINDSLGHSSGDILLVEVATRLKGALRESDVAARIGGDEFAVILPNIADSSIASKIGHEIIKALNKPIRLKSIDCFIGASIGASIFPDCSTVLDELVSLADTAMYESKRLGKNKLTLAPKKHKIQAS